jgi:pimeloyl-ACP methyl ester carboxylesterase
MKRSWADPQFWESMKTAQPDAMPAELREAYHKLAPKPENLESFFYKARDRMRDFKDVPDEAIHSINAPTLVVSSDRDVMRPEGAVGRVVSAPPGSPACDSARHRTHGDPVADSCPNADDRDVS